MRRVMPQPRQLSSLADALASVVTPLPSNDAVVECERADRARENVLAEARREGLAKGLADAEAEIARRTGEIAARLQAEHSRAMALVQEQIAALRKLGESLGAAVAQHRRESEEATVEAAYAALLQVLGNKAADRTLMPELCAHVLVQRGAGPVTLRLSIPDCALLEPSDEVRLLPDPALVNGQCLVESARGGSDTGLDVRLEAMKCAFLEGLAMHRGQP